MDNFERFGVTADWKKVLPGMVYVDLQDGKSRREIYNAYNNGASVIFTAQNITDPELPVIKVNNVYDTMLLLLNKHFENPQDKVKLIAVSGSNDKDIVMDLLQKMMGAPCVDSTSQDNLQTAAYVQSSNSMTIEDMYDHLNRTAATGERFMPIVVDYRLKYFKFINGFTFDCALITGVSNFDLGNKNYVLSSIRSFVSQIPENKPIIVNNDDDMVLKALEASRDTIVFTYGLNKKAAITATSIDIDHQTTFNYCLQRSFKTNSGKLLEPFEMPIKMNMLGSRSIYNALAVITCALYYDIDIERIKDVLMIYIPPFRRFEIRDNSGVTILDNYCIDAAELDKTLEGVQLLNYSRLKLLLSVNRDSQWQELEDIVKVIVQWQSILDIEEVVVSGCLDINDGITPISINTVRKMKKALSEHLQIRYFDMLQDALAYLSEQSLTGDMIVIAGGDEMNNARKVLEQNQRNSLH